MTGKQTEINLRCDRQRTINKLGAKDDFGREFGYIDGFRKDRYVGMFYFLWHGQHKSEMPGVYNVSELEKNDLPAQMQMLEYQVSFYLIKTPYLILSKYSQLSIYKLFVPYFKVLIIKHVTEFCRFLFHKSDSV